MKTILKIILPAIVLLTGCQLITEPDITDREVFLLAPVDSFVTETQTLTLWWEHVSDAEAYNIQVVSPDWFAIERLVIDSNITGNKFTVTLSPGFYAWGVQAYNYSSSTEYSVRTIAIDTSSSLNNQIVVLRSPESNHSTNNSKVIFQRYQLDAADSYIFDIRFDSWQGANVIPQQVTTHDTISLSLDEGVYYWGVKAINDVSSTVFSNQALYVDQTAPGKPVITQPQFNNDTLAVDAATIMWSRPTTSISPISDSLVVSIDSTFAEGSIQATFITQETEFTLQDFPLGLYFCRVRSFDAAGNIGPVSAVRKFHIGEE